MAAAAVAPPPTVGAATARGTTTMTTTDLSSKLLRRITPPPSGLPPLLPLLLPPPLPPPSDPHAFVPPRHPRRPTEGWVRLLQPSTATISSYRDSRLHRIIRDHSIRSSCIRSNSIPCGSSSGAVRPSNRAYYPTCTAAAVAAAAKAKAITHRDYTLSGVRTLERETLAGATPLPPPLQQQRQRQRRLGTRAALSSAGRRCEIVVCHPRNEPRTS